MAAFPVSVTKAQAPQVPEDFKAGKEIAELLGKEKMVEIRARFDTELAQQLSEASIKQAWQNALSTVGPFQNVVETKDLNTPQGDVVDSRCDCDRGAVTVRVAFNTSHKIIGLWVSPSLKASVKQDSEDSKSGKEVAELLGKEKISEIRARFDTALARQLSEAKIKEVWTGVLDTVGQFKNVAETKEFATPQGAVVDSRCDCDQGVVLVRVAFNADHKIIGLWVTQGAKANFP